MAELVAAVPRRQRRGRRGLTEEEEGRRHSEPVGDKWAEALAQYTADIESGLGRERLTRMDVLSQVSSQEWTGDAEISDSLPEIKLVKDEFPVSMDIDSSMENEETEQADGCDQGDSEEVTPRPSDQSSPVKPSADSSENSPSVEMSPVLIPRSADKQERDLSYQREKESRGSQNGKRSEERTSGHGGGHVSEGNASREKSETVTPETSGIMGNADNKESEGCYSTDSLDDSEQDPDSLSNPRDQTEVDSEPLNSSADLDCNIPVGFTLHKDNDHPDSCGSLDQREDSTPRLSDKQGSGLYSSSTECDETYMDASLKGQNEILREDSLDDVGEELDSGTPAAAVDCAGETDTPQCISTMSLTFQTSAVPEQRAGLVSAVVEPDSKDTETKPSHKPANYTDPSEHRETSTTAQTSHLIHDPESETKPREIGSGSEETSRQASSSGANGADEGKPEFSTSSSSSRVRDVGSVPVDMLTSWLAEEEGSQLSDEPLSSSRVEQQIQAWQEVLQQLSPRASGAAQGASGVNGAAAHNGSGRRGKRRQHTRALKGSDSDHAEHFSDDSLASGANSHPSSRPGSGSRRRRRPANKPSDTAVKRHRGYSTEEYVTSDNDSIFSDDSLTHSTGQNEAPFQVSDLKSSFQQLASGLPGSGEVTEADLEGTSMAESEKTNIPALVAYFEAQLKSRQDDKTTGRGNHGERERRSKISSRSSVCSDEGNSSASEGTQTVRGRVTMTKAPVCVLSAGDVNHIVSDGVLKATPETEIVHEESNFHARSRHSWKLSVTPADIWECPLAAEESERTLEEDHLENAPKRRNSKIDLHPTPEKRQRQDKLTDLHSKYGLMDEMDHLSDEGKCAGSSTDTPAKNLQQQDDSFHVESSTHKKTHVSKKDSDGKMRFEVTINKDETSVLYNVEQTEYKTYALRDREGNITEVSNATTLPDTININLTKTTTHQSENRLKTVTKERVQFQGHEGDRANEGVIVMEHKFAGKHTLDYEQEREGDTVTKEISVEHHLKDEDSNSRLRVQDSPNLLDVPSPASLTPSEVPSGVQCYSKSQIKLFVDNSETSARSSLLSANDKPHERGVLGGGAVEKSRSSGDGPDRSVSVTHQNVDVSYHSYRANEDKSFVKSSTETDSPALDSECSTMASVAFTDKGSSSNVHVEGSVRNSYPPKSVTDLQQYDNTVVEVSGRIKQLPGTLVEHGSLSGIELPPSLQKSSRQRSEKTAEVNTGEIENSHLGEENSSFSVETVSVTDQRGAVSLSGVESEMALKDQHSSSEDSFHDVLCIEEKPSALQVTDNLSKNYASQNEPNSDPARYRSTSTEHHDAVLFEDAGLRQTDLTGFTSSTPSQVGAASSFHSSQSLSSVHSSDQSSGRLPVQSDSSLPTSITDDIFYSPDTTIHSIGNNSVSSEYRTPQLSPRECTNRKPRVPPGSRLIHHYHQAIPPPEVTPAEETPIAGIPCALSTEAEGREDSCNRSRTGGGQTSLLSAMAAAVGRRVMGDEGEMEAMREMLKQEVERKIARLQRRVRSLSDSAISSDFTESESTSVSPRSSRIPVMDGKLENVGSDAKYYDAFIQNPQEAFLAFIEETDDPQCLPHVSERKKEILLEKSLEDSGNIHDDHWQDTCAEMPSGGVFSRGLPKQGRTLADQKRNKPPQAQRMLSVPRSEGHHRDLIAANETRDVEPSSSCEYLEQRHDAVYAFHEEERKCNGLASGRQSVSSSVRIANPQATVQCSRSYNDSYLAHARYADLFGLSGHFPERVVDAVLSLEQTWPPPDYTSHIFSPRRRKGFQRRRTKSLNNLAEIAAARNRSDLEENLLEQARRIMQVARVPSGTDLTINRQFFGNASGGESVFDQDGVAVDWMDGHFHPAKSIQASFTPHRPRAPNEGISNAWLVSAEKGVIKDSTTESSVHDQRLLDAEEQHRNLVLKSLSEHAALGEKQMRLASWITKWDTADSASNQHGFQPSAMSVTSATSVFGSSVDHSLSGSVNDQGQDTGQDFSHHPQTSETESRVESLQTSEEQELDSVSAVAAVRKTNMDMKPHLLHMTGTPTFHKGKHRSAAGSSTRSSDTASDLSSPRRWNLKRCRRIRPHYSPTFRQDRCLSPGELSLPEKTVQWLQHARLGLDEHESLGDLLQSSAYKMLNSAEFTAGQLNMLRCKAVSISSLGHGRYTKEEDEQELSMWEMNRPASLACLEGLVMEDSSEDEDSSADSICFVFMDQRNPDVAAQWRALGGSFTTSDGSERMISHSQSTDSISCGQMEKFMPPLSEQSASLNNICEAMYSNVQQRVRLHRSRSASLLDVGSSVVCEDESDEHIFPPRVPADSEASLERASNVHEADDLPSQGTYPDSRSVHTDVSMNVASSIQQVLFYSANSVDRSERHMFVPSPDQQCFSSKTVHAGNQTNQSHYEVGKPHQAPYKEMTQDRPGVITEGESGQPYFRYRYLQQLESGAQTEMRVDPTSNERPDIGSENPQPGGVSPVRRSQSTGSLETLSDTGASRENSPRSRQHEEKLPLSPKSKQWIELSYLMLETTHILQNLQQTFPPQSVSRSSSSGSQKIPDNSMTKPTVPCNAQDTAVKSSKPQDRMRELGQQPAAHTSSLLNDLSLSERQFSGCLDSSISVASDVSMIKMKDVPTQTGSSSEELATADAGTHTQVVDELSPQTHWSASGSRPAVSDASSSMERTDLADMTCQTDVVDTGSPTAVRTMDTSAITENFNFGDIPSQSDNTFAQDKSLKYEKTSSNYFRCQTGEEVSFSSLSRKVNGITEDIKAVENTGEETSPHDKLADPDSSKEQLKHLEASSQTDGPSINLKRDREYIMNIEDIATNDIHREAGTAVDTHVLTPTNLISRGTRDQNTTDICCQTEHMSPRALSLLSEDAGGQLKEQTRADNSCQTEDTFAYSPVRSLTDGNSKTVEDARQAEFTCQTEETNTDGHLPRTTRETSSNTMDGLGTDDFMNHTVEIDTGRGIFRATGDAVSAATDVNLSDCSCQTDESNVNSLVSRTMTESGCNTERLESIEMMCQTDEIPAEGTAHPLMKDASSSMDDVGFTDIICKREDILTAPDPELVTDTGIRLGMSAIMADATHSADVTYHHSVTVDDTRNTEDFKPHDISCQTDEIQYQVRTQSRDNANSTENLPSVEISYQTDESYVEERAYELSVDYINDTSISCSRNQTGRHMATTSTQELSKNASIGADIINQTEAFIQNKPVEQNADSDGDFEMLCVVDSSSQQANDIEIQTATSDTVSRTDQVRDNTMMKSDSHSAESSSVSDSQSEGDRKTTADMENLITLNRLVHRPSRVDIASQTEQSFVVEEDQKTEDVNSLAERLQMSEITCQTELYPENKAAIKETRNASSSMENLQTTEKTIQTDHVGTRNTSTRDVSSNVEFDVCESSSQTDAGCIRNENIPLNKETKDVGVSVSRDSLTTTEGSCQTDEVLTKWTGSYEREHSPRKESRTSSVLSTQINENNSDLQLYQTTNAFCETLDTSCRDSVCQTDSEPVSQDDGSSNREMKREPETFSSSQNTILEKPNGESRTDMQSSIEKAKVDDCACQTDDRLLENWVQNASSAPSHAQDTKHMVCTTCQTDEAPQIQPQDPTFNNEQSHSVLLETSVTRYEKPVTDKPEINAPHTMDRQSWYGSEMSRGDNEGSMWSTAPPQCRQVSVSIQPSASFPPVCIAVHEKDKADGGSGENNSPAITPKLSDNLHDVIKEYGPYADQNMSDQVPMEKLDDEVSGRGPVSAKEAAGNGHPAGSLISSSDSGKSDVERHVAQAEDVKDLVSTRGHAPGDQLSMPAVQFADRREGTQFHHKHVSSHQALSPHETVDKRQVPRTQKALQDKEIAGADAALAQSVPCEQPISPDEGLLEQDTHAENTVDSALVSSVSAAVGTSSQVVWSSNRQDLLVTQRQKTDNDVIEETADSVHTDWSTSGSSVFVNSSNDRDNTDSVPVVHAEARQADPVITRSDMISANTLSHAASSRSSDKSTLLRHSVQNESNTVSLPRMENRTEIPRDKSKRNPESKVEEHFKGMIEGSDSLGDVEVEGELSYKREESTEEARAFIRSVGLVTVERGPTITAHSPSSYQTNSDQRIPTDQGYSDDDLADRSKSGRDRRDSDENKGGELSFKREERMEESRVVVRLDSTRPLERGTGTMADSDQAVHSKKGSSDDESLGRARNKKRGTDYVGQSVLDEDTDYVGQSVLDEDTDYVGQSVLDEDTEGGLGFDSDEDTETLPSVLSPDQVISVQGRSDTKVHPTSSLQIGNDQEELTLKQDFTNLAEREHRGNVADVLTEGSFSDSDLETEGELSYKRDEKIEETRNTIRLVDTMTVERGQSVTAPKTSPCNVSTTDQNDSFEDNVTKSGGGRYDSRDRRDSDSYENEGGEHEILGRSRNTTCSREYEEQSHVSGGTKGEQSFNRDEKTEKSRDFINPERVMSVEHRPRITVRSASPLEKDIDQVSGPQQGDFGQIQPTDNSTTAHRRHGEVSYYRHETLEEGPRAQLSVPATHSGIHLPVSSDLVDDALSPDVQQRSGQARPEYCSLTDIASHRTSAHSVLEPPGNPNGTSDMTQHGEVSSFRSSDITNEIEKLREEHNRMMQLLQRSCHRSSPLLNRLYRARSASPSLMHGGSCSSSSGSPVTVIAGIGSVRGSPVTFTTNHSPCLSISRLITGSVDETVSSQTSRENSVHGSSLKRHSIATSTADDFVDTIQGEWQSPLSHSSLPGVMPTSSTPDLRSETQYLDESLGFPFTASTGSGTVIKPLAIYANVSNQCSQHEEFLNLQDSMTNSTDKGTPTQNFRMTKSELSSTQTTVEVDKRHQSVTTSNLPRRGQSRPERDSNTGGKPSGHGNLSGQSVEPRSAASCGWENYDFDQSQDLEMSQPPLDTRHQSCFIGAQPSYSTRRRNQLPSAITVASPRSDLHQRQNHNQGHLISQMVTDIHAEVGTVSDMHDSFADGERTPDFLIQTPRSMGGVNVPPLDHQLVPSLISKAVEAIVNSSDDFTQTDADDDSLHLSQLDTSRGSLASNNGETCRIRAELDRLHQERIEIIELLSLKYLPGSLTVELLEAKLNYCLGQTDMLLASLEKAWKEDEENEYSKHRSKKHEELLLKYRQQVEQSRQDINVCMEESRRMQSGTRGRRVARTRDVIAMKRRAEIEAFKQERKREQEWYSRHRNMSPDLSDCNSEASSSRPFDPRFMTPRQHKEHLLRLRRSLVAASSEELDRLRRQSQSSSISLSPERSISPVSSLSNVYPSRDSSLGSSFSLDRHPSNSDTESRISVSFSTPSLITPASYTTSTLGLSAACSTPSLHLPPSPQQASRSLAPPEPMRYRGQSIPRHPKSYLTARSSSCGPAMSRQPLTPQLVAPPLTYQERQADVSPLWGSADSLDPEQLLQESYAAKQLNRQQIVKAQEALRLLEEHRHGFHSQIRHHRRGSRRQSQRGFHRTPMHTGAAFSNRFSEQAIQQEITNLQQQHMEHPGDGTGLDSGVMSLSLQDSVSANIPPESTSTPRSTDETFADYAQDVLVGDERHVQSVLGHTAEVLREQEAAGFDLGEVSTSGTPSSLLSTDLESFLDLSTSSGQQPTSSQVPSSSSSRPVSSQDIKARIGRRRQEQSKGKSSK